MVEKTTQELNYILENIHPNEFSNYCEENKSSIIDQENFFSTYVKDIVKQNNILLQDVFLNADIPERYGYKLLSGEKHTKQRDIIIRICYAGKLTLAQTQKALKAYGMPELYSRVARDAAIMICFNERPGSILDVNSFLKENHLQPLRSSGTQD